MTTPEVLRAAADYIRVHGWRRGGDGVKDGRVCLTMAVRSVASSELSVSYALSWLQAHLGIFFLNNWNDRQKSRKAVLDALEGAAQLAEKEAM